MVIVICEIKNICFLVPNVLGFVACRVKSKVLGIGSADHAWCYVNAIKFDKIFAIRSDVSEKNSIVCTSAYI